jgi:hypothetical protein
MFTSHLRTTSTARPYEAAATDRHIFRSCLVLWGVMELVQGRMVTDDVERMAAFYGRLVGRR